MYKWYLLLLAAILSFYTHVSQDREGCYKPVYHRTGREARNWSITVQGGKPETGQSLYRKEVRNRIITVQEGKPETGQSQYREGSQKLDNHTTGREVRNRIITGQGGKSETGLSQDRDWSQKRDQKPIITEVIYNTRIQLSYIDKFQKKTIIHPNTANKENLIWAIFQYLLCKNDKHILSSCSTIFKDLLNQPSQLCRFYLHNISRIFEQRALNNIYYYEE